MPSGHTGRLRLVLLVPPQQELETPSTTTKGTSAVAFRRLEPFFPAIPEDAVSHMVDIWKRQDKAVRTFVFILS